MQWQVYILYSEVLDRYYIGVTSDLEARLEKHITHYYGKTHFTAKANDWRLCLSINCFNEKQAKCIERHIKKSKSRQYVESLIENEQIQAALLAKY